MKPIIEKLPIKGVHLVHLTSHNDYRGTFTEVFREEWATDIEPCQWNIVHSKANVLRGVHVHSIHVDYLLCLSGKLTIGLKDMRPSAPSFGISLMEKMDFVDPVAIVIPPGVAHGFYFHEPSIHLYAVSEYWDKEDELGCQWNDTDLEFNWPCDVPVISERDMELGSYAEAKNIIEQKFKQYAIENV